MLSHIEISTISQSVLASTTSAKPKRSAIQVILSSLGCHHPQVSRYAFPLKLSWSRAHLLFQR
jgi:hypothetical protein